MACISLQANRYSLGLGKGHKGAAILNVIQKLVFPFYPEKILVMENTGPRE